MGTEQSSGVSSIDERSLGYMGNDSQHRVSPTFGKPIWERSER